VWGARVRVNPTPNWYLAAGAYQVAPNYGQRGQEFNLGFDGTTGTYLPFETGITSLSTDRVPNGRRRFGFNYDASNVTTFE
jgi:porin